MIAFIYKIFIYF